MLCPVCNGPVTTTEPDWLGDSIYVCDAYEPCHWLGMLDSFGFEVFEFPHLSVVESHIDDDGRMRINKTDDEDEDDFTQAVRRAIPHGKLLLWKAMVQDWRVVTGGLG